jgi:hypothetical protein
VKISGFVAIVTGFVRATKMAKSRAIFITIVVIAVLVGTFKWWGAGQHHRASDSQETTTPDAQTQQATKESQKRREEAQGCAERAMMRLQQTWTEQPQQHARTELEESWVEYLQSIQAEGNFPNWSGRPCDLYLQNRPSTVGRAVELGFATIEARGDGLEKVQLTVTSTPQHPIVNQSLVVAAGTLFTSSSAGTQSMIAATSVRFQFYPVGTNTTDDTSSSLNKQEWDFEKPQARPAVFYPGKGAHIRNIASDVNIPQSVTQDVPSYCINRWREVPGSDAHFSVSEPDESNPLRKLAACLDQSSADHRDKQLAVWMVSDHLLELTTQELADKFFAEFKSHAVTPTPAEFADYLKKIKPDTSEEELEAIRHLTPGQILQVRDEALKRRADEEVQEYLKITRPLLEGCGIDVSSAAIYR